MLKKKLKKINCSLIYSKVRKRKGVFTDVFDAP